MASVVGIFRDESKAWIRETAGYMAHIREFSAWDWICYIAWIGTISSLFFGVTAFTLAGKWSGVVWPGYVYTICFGTGLFTVALAVDTIGHRTVYKAELLKGEAYVHHMIIVTAVTSVMALCLGYSYSETMRMPALGLIGLSLFYSAIDEALHWRRYLSQSLDRVEMWSHFLAIAGHVLMILSWWQWYSNGYPGVAQTLIALGM